MNTDLNLCPVIFIPGIMGSTLSDHYPIEHKVVYSAVTDKLMADFDPIMLDERGEYDKQLDRLIYENEVISLVYGEMVGELRENLPLDEKQAEYAKVYLFPYDWRYPIPSHAERLGRFIDLIIAKTNAHPIYKERGLKIDKVNIVGHSMGGCLAKYYATVYGGETKINKLVMLASPLRGSLYALKHLVMGETWFFDWFVRKGKRKVARTFPGCYDLLPFDGMNPDTKKIPWSMPAVVFKNKPVNLFDARKWQPNVAAQIGSETLSRHLKNSFIFFDNSKDFSDTFKDNVLAIYGTGEKTLRQAYISSTEPVEFDFPKDQDCPMIGDGTVPAVSTFTEGIYQVGVTKKRVGDWELDLGKLAGFHASFCAYDLVQDLVISFLRGKVIKTVTKEFGYQEITQFPSFTIDHIKRLDEEPE